MAKASTDIVKPNKNEGIKRKISTLISYGTFLFTVIGFILICISLTIIGNNWRFRVLLAAVAFIVAAFYTLKTFRLKEKSFLNISGILCWFTITIIDLIAAFK
jgi:hypothetical protein